ncbi:MAG: hypothetical protein JW990_14770 [Thermoleophilia bacterium]|nr:hypothetical protein [Thermoleophilia bacterium]
MSNADKPWTAKLLIGLIIFQALSAIGGGVGLIQDPVENIGMPVSLLEGTPFDDYLIPGLILLVVVGLEPLIAFFGLIGGRTWGWWVALVAGGDLLVWVIVEILLLGYLPGFGIALQIVYALVAVAILGCALARATRDYYEVSLGAPAV